MDIVLSCPKNNQYFNILFNLSLISQNMYIVVSVFTKNRTNAQSDICNLSGHIKRHGRKKESDGESYILIICIINPH
jgi:hypothetical protein